MRFILFKKAFFIIFFCHSVWPMLTLASEKSDPERVYLLNKHHGVYKAIKEEKDLERKVPSEEKSKVFREGIDNLAKVFETFETLSPDEQKYLLDKWGSKVYNWGIHATLSREGFNGGLEVSEETKQKLKKVQALYPKEIHLCAII